MGTSLSASGVRGWLNLWKGALRNGANGHFADKLEMVFKPAGVLDKDGLVKFLEMFDGAGSSTYKFTPHPTDPKKWISPAGLIWEGQSVRGAPREGHRTIHVLTHAVENPGRTLANEAHGIFTIPSDQLFPLLDSFVGNVPGLTKMPVVGRANTWDMTFQNFVGLADNIPGSLSVTRQGAGYVPTKTVRIAVKSDGTVITAFPYNPAP
jgi:hypothetical protein